MISLFVFEQSEYSFFVSQCVNISFSHTEFTLGAVPLESPTKSSSGDRLAKMAQVAEELREKKIKLNDLAETIVARREALIKAQEEYKRFQHHDLCIFVQFHSLMGLHVLYYFIW